MKIFQSTEIIQSLYRIKEEAGSKKYDITLLGQYSLRLEELRNAKKVQ